MGYRKAVEAAGALVHDYQMFGSYQGDFFMLVTYKGSNGVIKGSFGSCSGCDAFEAEFDNAYPSTEDEKEKLKRFGESYLKEMLTLDEATNLIKGYENNFEWDEDAKDVAKWLKNLHNFQFGEKLERVVYEDT